MWNFRTPANLHRKLKELAFYTGTSMNQLVIDILEKANLDKRVAEARERYDRNKERYERNSEF